MPDSKSLVPLIKKFVDNNPVSAAHYIESLHEDEAIQVLNSLPPQLTTRIMRYIQPRYAASLFNRLELGTFQNIITQLEPQLASRVFLSLGDEDRKKLLEYLSEDIKREIQDLLSYPENSVGRIMTMEFIAFHADLKAKDAISKIRQLVKKEFPASYLYVIDSENHLIGIINMRDLLLAQTDATLGSIMRKEVYSINAFMDIEEVASELGKRRYFALPVVDSENQLLGIVRTEQLISQVQEEATEDIQKMFGAGGDERVFSPISYSLKKRLPWLHVNLATAFLAAAVVAIFEDIIAKVTILAVFLPVVAGQGGNAGAQSLAVVMRGLVMHEIPKHKATSLVMKEAALGTVNGIVIGIVTAFIAWLWHGNPYLGLVIGLAMIVNLFAAGFFGAAIPISMKKMGLDPAQSSNIILTTVTDVLGFFSFLGFAVLFKQFLV